MSTKLSSKCRRQKGEGMTVMVSTEERRSEKKSGPYEDRTHDLRVISTAL